MVTARNKYLVKVSSEKFLALAKKIVLLTFSLLRIPRTLLWYATNENFSCAERLQSLVEG